jgi:hypothetical protein
VLLTCGVASAVLTALQALLAPPLQPPTTPAGHGSPPCKRQRTEAGGHQEQHQEQHGHYHQEQQQQQQHEHHHQEQQVQVELLNTTLCLAAKLLLHPSGPAVGGLDAAFVATLQPALQQVGPHTS